jgi:hypothetical protein
MLMTDEEEFISNKQKMTDEEEFISKKEKN